MKIGSLAALVALTLACGATRPTETTTPEPAPPRGKSYQDYLDSGRPEKPAESIGAERMTMHVIDIGQGLAVLLEFPCAAVLVDTGGEKNESFDSTAALGEFLAELFARRTDLRRTIAGLLITHPHIDHTRGIETVTRSFSVGNVVTNGQELDDLGGRPQIQLHQWVDRTNRKRRGEPAVGFESIDTVVLGPEGTSSAVVDPVGTCADGKIDPEIKVLWGGVVGERGYSKNPNDHSLVIRVDFGKSSVLITGDLELEGLDHLGRRYATRPDLLDVDVYVVGHHGSKNATAPHLMRAMSPKIAVISAGPYERNLPWTARKYGHPNRRVIELLEDPTFGVSWFRDSTVVWEGISGAWKERESVFEERAVNRAIYSTGWDGTVAVHLYASGWLEVETARSRARATPESAP